MTQREKKLLAALALMIDQHVRRYGDEVDTLAENANQHAVEALADFGLMEVLNTRLGRWTEAGRKFVEEAKWPYGRPTSLEEVLRYTSRGRL